MYNDFDWQLQEIEDYKGVVIYGFQEDMKWLNKAVAFIYLHPTFRKYKNKALNIVRGYRKSQKWGNLSEETGYINEKACKIIKISKQNEKYFKNKTNMIHVKQMYSDNKLFRQLASVYRIENVLGQYLKNYSSYKTESFIEFVKEIHKDIGETFKDLYEYQKSFMNNEDMKYTTVCRNDLKQEIIGIAEKLNLFDITVEYKIKKVEEYFKGVELLKYIDFNEANKPIILKYLREKKKKVNLEYYCKVVEPEKMEKLENAQLIIDFNPKEEETKTLFKIITEVA